jgi:hypothetical protein
MILIPFLIDPFIFKEEFGKIVVQFVQLRVTEIALG